MGKNRKMGEVYSSCAFEQETNKPIKGGLFDENIFGKKDTWLPDCENFGDIPNFLPKEVVGNFGKIVLPAIFNCFIDERQKVDEILVLPPIFRPIKKLKVGQWATSDLNYLYRKIVVRNERLKRMLALSDTPLGVIKVECELLQEAILDLKEELKRLLRENPNVDVEVRNAIEMCIAGKISQKYNKKADKEALYKQALKVAIVEETVSFTILQRKLCIGYNLAGQMLERMEQEGFIGPFCGAKSRKVLITKEKYQELYGEEI